MKRTRNSNKQPVSDPKPKRKRRSNLELAGFGREHLKTIRMISDQSRVPIDQVLADVIENGLITVMPMYETMIEFRRTRETRLKNLFLDHEPIPTEPVGPGGSEEQPEEAPSHHRDTDQSAGFANGDVDALDGGGNDRSGDVVIGPGFEPETDPGFVSVAED